MPEPSDFQGVAVPAGREQAWRAGAVWRASRRICRGIAAGLRARSGVFLAVAAGVFALEVLLPPAVLSAARRPVDYFTFNSWLPELPRFLSASDITWERKLDFLPNLALFWFSADSPFGGTDWGFAVTVSDLLRFLLMSLHRRDTLLSRYATTPQRPIEVILLSLQVVVVDLHGRFLPSQLVNSGGGSYGWKS